MYFSHFNQFKSCFFLISRPQKWWDTNFHHFSITRDKANRKNTTTTHAQEHKTRNFHLTIT